MNAEYVEGCRFFVVFFEDCLATFDSDYALLLTDPSGEGPRVFEDLKKDVRAYHASAVARYEAATAA